MADTMLGQTTWGDKKFIEDWASKGSWQAPIRNVQTAMVLRMIPQPIDAPIRVLDIGAGYGALAAAVLTGSSQCDGGVFGRFGGDVEARSRAKIPDLKQSHDLCSRIA